MNALSPGPPSAFLTMEKEYKFQWCTACLNTHQRTLSMVQHREKEKGVGWGKGGGVTWLINESHVGSHHFLLFCVKKTTTCSKVMFLKAYCGILWQYCGTEEIKHTQKQTEEWHDRNALHSWWTDVSAGHHPTVLLQNGMHQREEKEMSKKCEFWLNRVSQAFAKPGAHSIQYTALWSMQWSNDTGE